MTTLMDFPLRLFAVTFVTLWLFAWIGAAAFRKLRSEATEMQENFAVVQGATLTLLGLIIGFTFSMALTRYDQRKNYEEQEANAIGTEYVRADLLPASDAAKVRALLVQYVEQRELFYRTRDAEEYRQVNIKTAKLQAELWKAVTVPTSVQPNPLGALVLAGMNDVLNTQGYTQAAWWNRIPHAAWLLMSAIALVSTMLVGIGAKKARAGSALLVVLPLVIAIAFFLIADIDSPRGGVIRVSPQNLQSLLQALRAQ
ncbi:MAG: hypothetical protein ABI537_02145 [Casimicrobiaceae bacterium]